jgi:hypothetical protein
VDPNGRALAKMAWKAGPQPRVMKTKIFHPLKGPSQARPAGAGRLEDPFQPGGPAPPWPIGARQRAKRQWAPGAPSGVRAAPQAAPQGRPRRAKAGFGRLQLGPATVLALDFGHDAS